MCRVKTGVLGCDQIVSQKTRLEIVTLLTSSGSLSTGPDVLGSFKNKLRRGTPAEFRENLNCVK
jgi:hypothetical protein